LEQTFEQQASSVCVTHCIVQFINEQSVQVCDATNADITTTAGFIIIY